MANPRVFGICDDELQTMLEKGLRRSGVPGAQIGVISPGEGDELRKNIAVAGVTSLRTGYPVTPHTLFQIGSISKIFTTMLAMQLVDEGRLSLDTKVHDMLPEFSLRDSAENTTGCTIRHLMNHTSGIEGDAFPDLGRGDDCVERYVRYIGEFPARTEVGGSLSYSNGAFVVLGRVIEVARGMTWDEAIQHYIAQPAGFTHVWTLPEDVIRFSSALGHNRAVSADMKVFPAPVEPSDVWQLPRCSGPCGSISATMGDLLDFASVFLRNGAVPNGRHLISTESCSLMTHESVSLRDQGVENIGWALGWQLPNWGSEPAYGHGGATEGQRAKIIIFPNRRLIIAVLTNAQAGSEMAAFLEGTIAKRFGIQEPLSPTVTDNRITAQVAASVTGRYQRHNTDFSLMPGGSTGLRAVFEPDPEDGEFGARVCVEVHQTAEGFYAVQFPSDMTPTELAFVPRPDGGLYAAIGHRLTPRTSVEPQHGNCTQCHQGCH